MLSAEAVELFAATLPNAEEAALEELWEMSLDEEGASFSLDELSELLFRCCHERVDLGLALAELLHIRLFGLGEGGRLNLAV